MTEAYEAKILSVRINGLLSFKRHYENVTTGPSVLSNTLYKINHYFPTIILKMFYMVLGYSINIYGFLIWGIETV